MAAQIAQDVVKEAQSMGASSIDAPGNSTNQTSTGHGQTTYTHDSNDGSFSEDVDPQRHNLHADVFSISDGRNTPDTAVTDAIIDGSVGSDSEANKENVGIGQDHAPGHVRTNSTAKRPAAFKSVSVTKNFLAKATTATPTVRMGDKVGPSILQTGAAAALAAKPRLVAKATLGNMSTRTGTPTSGIAGPDAATVWNKNKVPTPAAPRQFTDEELKQQYGIHMATRLQADESGKESKWADIDDDEDDWAPEAVEWVDGTKSNVVAATPISSAASPAVGELPNLAAETDNAGAIKPVGPISTPSSTSLSSKTILKPGVLAATQAIQAKNAPKATSGLSVKSPTEKPALVSKAAPIPAKSPWATLPPVNKVPPIFPEPPQQLQNNQHSAFRRDPHGFDALPPPPPREMAADTFDRSWRPDDRGGRELYNSRSGTYEPVNHNRRGSYVRPDRQPAVLRRPSQSDHSSAPEPSAAFQTRRLSSNAGANGARRLSFLRAVEDRPELHAMSQDGAAVMDSPLVSHGNLSGPPSAGFEHPGGAPPGPQAPSVPNMEDALAAQKEYINASRERARAAKQQQIEAEQAEEAARKERLRLKMEQLAAASAPKTDARSDAKVDGNNATSSQPAVPASASAPPKPPQPTRDGEVAQYGVMKVHSVKKSPSLTRPEPRVEAAGSTTTNSGVPSGHPALTQDANANANKRNLSNQPSQGPSPSNVNPWKTVVPPTQWNNNSSPSNSAANNVWGPLQSTMNNRSLGNGTFNSIQENSAFAPIGSHTHSPEKLPQYQQSQAGPTPYGSSAPGTRLPSGSSHLPPPALQDQPHPQNSVFDQQYINLEHSRPTSAHGSQIRRQFDNLRGPTSDNFATTVDEYPYSDITVDQSRFARPDNNQYPGQTGIHSRRGDYRTRNQNRDDGRYPTHSDNWQRSAVHPFNESLDTLPKPISSSTIGDLALSQATGQPQVQLPGNQPPGFSSLTNMTNTMTDHMQHSSQAQNGPYASLQQQANVGSSRNRDPLGPNNMIQNQGRNRGNYSANMGQNRNSGYVAPVAKVRGPQPVSGSAQAGNWQNFADNCWIDEKAQRDKFMIQAGLTPHEYKSPAANMGARIEPHKSVAPVGTPATQPARSDAALAPVGTPASGNQKTASVIGSSPSQQAGQNASHVSKFFPTGRPHEAGSRGDTQIVPPAPVRPFSPPSDTDGLFGDAGSKINVKLPTPKATVKLPSVRVPATSSPAVLSTLNAQRRSENLVQRTQNEHAMSRDMKQRIDNLLGHKGSEVMSTKPQLELGSHQTIVSLPNSPNTATMSSKTEFESTSKSMTDELFEDRSFGSLPGVRIPKAPYDQIHYAATSADEQIPAIPIDAASKHGIEINAELAGSMLVVTIHMPLSDRTSTAQMPVPAHMRQPNRYYPNNSSKPRRFNNPRSGGGWNGSGSPEAGMGANDQYGRRSASTNANLSQGSGYNARPGRGSRAAGGHRGGFARRAVSTATP